MNDFIYIFVFEKYIFQYHTSMAPLSVLFENIKLRNMTIAEGANPTMFASNFLYLRGRDINNSFDEIF